jgi:hypothetical protein
MAEWIVFNHGSFSLLSGGSSYCRFGSLANGSIIAPCSVVGQVFLRIADKKSVVRLTQKANAAGRLCPLPVRRHWRAGDGFLTRQFNKHALCHERGSLKNSTKSAV